ncbi:methyltransferase domain-containing protein [Candidatus Dojkabacteria bacterium]|uniref:Methyltransferase domain-containing protein n=1 Tax=Candidatus Dojkabacteria bacterium TaxID=2099670 RepID=A0A955I7A2_9BACT|nr:methyltransferase domain-containing protein [Candidatus Dojkabacteria bacterium]
MILKRILKQIDRALFPKFYNGGDDYRELLSKEILDGNESLLDIGCGGNSPAAKAARQLKYSMGVDGFGPAVDGSRQAKTHTENKQMNILNVAREFKPKSFDCVVALDLIEHQTKEEGEKLLRDMESIAKKKVVIFTPNGFVHQGEYDGNDFQIHKSGWTAAEMRARGFRVYGLNGLRYLRGEYARPKWRPEWFWQRILYHTQWFVRLFPRFAYQILAVKELS